MANAVFACAAIGAPELLVNGSGESPPGTGWVVQGNAASVESVEAGSGVALGPAQGARFFRLGPGSFTTLSQSGPFPMSSERLVLRGFVRAPEFGSVFVRIRAFSATGVLLVERSSVAPPPGPGWSALAVTYAIPQGAQSWDATVFGLFPGASGVHADGLLLVPTCVADFTGDRVLNFFDFAAFIARFSAQDPAADLTGNGVIDFFDITEMVDSFESGCE